ncbi:hypothetical protein Tco_0306834, partial [Tanacetum coccineum]
TEKKHIVTNKPELNEHMMDWIIAKYVKPNTNWTEDESFFDIIADDVWKHFLINQSVQKSSKIDVQDDGKTDVSKLAPTAVVEADQGL